VNIFGNTITGNAAVGAYDCSTVFESYSKIAYGCDPEYDLFNKGMNSTIDGNLYPEIYQLVDSREENRYQPEFAARGVSSSVYYQVLPVQTNGTINCLENAQRSLPYAEWQEFVSKDRELRCVKRPVIPTLSVISVVPNYPGTQTVNIKITRTKD